MCTADIAVEGAVSLAERIVMEEPRRLFRALIAEIVRFPGRVTVETTPFEVRFSGDGGFHITVSPYRELFLVSVGSATPCSLRVSTEEGFLAAVDLSLQHFLECAGSDAH
jgi:hypothetical protein